MNNKLKAGAGGALNDALTDEGGGEHVEIPSES